MSFDEIKEALDKNHQLAKGIYEDAAVQSIMDRKLSEFRYGQYQECIEYNKKMELFVEKKARETTLVDK